jgi:hypothetical protein
MNEKNRIMRRGLPDQPVGDAIPQIHAERLRQCVHEVTAPRLVEDPLECGEQMTERTDASWFNPNRFPRNYEASPPADLAYGVFNPGSECVRRVVVRSTRE